MWARLIILILLGTAAVVAVQHWLGPKLLRVPFVWRSMARRHPDLQDALRIRLEIGRLLLSRSESRAKSMMAEVDRVIEALVLLARARDSRGVDAEYDETSRTAINELNGLHDQLKLEASERTEDVLDQVRERLATTTSDLRESTQVRSELGD